MKTFLEIRKEVLLAIEKSEEIGPDKMYSFADIETMTAKAYAKQWVEQAAYVAMDNAEVGLPVGDPILKLLKDIDAQ